MRRCHWVEGSGHASKNSHACTSLYGPSIHSGPGPPTSIIDQENAPTDMFTGQSDGDIFSVVVASSRRCVKLTKKQHTKEERSSLVPWRFHISVQGACFVPSSNRQPHSSGARCSQALGPQGRLCQCLNPSQSEDGKRGHPSSWCLLHFLLIICDVLW